MNSQYNINIDLHNMLLEELNQIFQKLLLFGGWYNQYEILVNLPENLRPSKLLMSMKNKLGYISDEKDHRK